MKTWSMALVCVVGLLSLFAQGQTHGQITVLAGMGVISGVRDLAPAFEQKTGHKVIVRFEQTADLTQMINSGFAADIAALQPQQIDTFIRGRQDGRRDQD